MPKPEADKQTSSETEALGDSTASQNKNNQVTSGSDTNSQQPKSQDQKTIDRAFFEGREAKRESKEKDSTISAMQAQIDELKVGSRSASSDGEEASSPDLHKELERFKGKLLQEFEGREVAKRIAQEESQADQWLSSRQYVNEDDAFADVVAGLIHSKYKDIASINPMVAAKQAYRDVCDMKGVVDSSPDLSSARASGGAGSSAPAGVKSSAMDEQTAKSILNDTDWNDPKQRAEANRLIAEAKKAGK